MRDTDPVDVPKFLIDNARTDSKSNKPALVRLERAIADIATENTNMGIERSQTEFAPKLHPRDLDRIETSSGASGAVGFVRMERSHGQDETAEHAVASWVIGMAYTDLKLICVGLERQAKERPPTTYQDFVELLHSWAVGVVDPPGNERC
jgi:hypothetical protein